MDLLNATPVTSSAQPGHYRFNQTNNYWAVIGVRPPPGSDYDLHLYLDNLDSTLLASSSYTGTVVDFIAGDYNHSPLGYYYPKVTLFNGSGSYTVERENGTEQLSSDGTTGTINWTSSNVVKVWDVYLTAGRQYRFTLNMISGTANVGIALFKSTASAYYAGRSSNAAIADAGGSGGGETFTYTAPASDWYGFIVWSNNTAGASFTVSAETISSLEEISGKVPAEYMLNQNYPNPFNPVTTIEFAIPNAGHTTLKIYNLLGEEIATLVDEYLCPSTYRAGWNSAGFAGGTYCYRLRSGDFAETKKLLLLK